jgi:hypothetical protein
VISIPEALRKFLRQEFSYCYIPQSTNKFFPFFEIVRRLSHFYPYKYIKDTLHKQKKEVNIMKKLVMVLIMSVICSMMPFSVFADTIGSARISLMEGDVLVQTKDIGTEWMAASINVPLLSGDKIWVSENGRSEIQFLGGSYIRADKNTGLDIRDSEVNITQVAVTQGRIYMHSNGSADSNSVFQVDTPLISAMAYSSAIFDIYIYEDGYTEVSVIKGDVYVEGQYGRTKVNTGDMLSIGADKYAELSPSRLNDGWLSWNMSRDSLIARTGPSINYLPSSLYNYSADFDQYGQWVRTSDYGYVWSPRITVNTWAPYGNGRWIWRNNDYVWVSYEPWGWVPYHYGRWAFSVGIGWVWVPPAANDVFWGPGFVAWINTPTYVSWVPLAPGEIYYGHGHYGRHSVNITKVNIKNINVTNVYLNSKVAHAVSLVHHDDFTKGKHVKVTNASVNPFLAGLRVSAGRPSVKQVNHSPLPLKVVQQKHLPPKTMMDTKENKGLSSRYIALNKNISTFKGSKPISPIRVNVIKDQKSISSNQRLHSGEPKTIPQTSNQVQRQELRDTPPTKSTVRRVEPKTAPQANRQVQLQQPKKTSLSNTTSVRPVEPRTTPQANRQFQQQEPKNIIAQNNNPTRR